MQNQPDLDKLNRINYMHYSSPGYSLTSIYIRDAPMSAIKEALAQIVSGVETMTIDFKPSNMGVLPLLEDTDYELWRIEYGTKMPPDNLSPDQLQQYYLTLYNANKVCETVVNRFPTSAHELEPFDENEMPQPIEMIRKWSVVQVCAFVLQRYPFNIDEPDSDPIGDSSTIALQFTHNDGDRHTRFWIYEHVKSMIEQWNSYRASRRSYVTLMEGIQHHNGDDAVSGYLFNEMICREVCTFL